MNYSDLAGLVRFRAADRVLASARKTSPFSAGWSSTVALLERELRMLRAVDATLELEMTQSAIRQDGLPRADARVHGPGVVLRFRSLKLGHDLHYEVATYRSWQDNVRAIALALEALRAVDRYGVTRAGEQYRGWAQLTAGAGDGDAARGRVLIEQAGSVKAALKAAHPDHGGEPDDFRDVMAAKDGDGL